ncbi:long-chain-fatty-acid--CoA ligase [Acidiferrimicrobium sp. IK]|uniref:long-chain-fatty-acid--CoA ligase n=1 Tax=Acidiferrimicrobium sp. IK TaxID=2871700 RepID=UPI0021CB45CF|nr:long-chain-fatty-acid--CoA ligase [Acidiferrimicrobium sp. IK]MCU4186653.1 long-chain-fatty-acid--CoA ligase [Acidiferrimicrobium sp. IK]
MTGPDSAPSIDSVAAIVRAHARAGGGRPAVTCEQTTLTFEDLDVRSSRVANALAAEGLRVGDRVAYLDRNAPEFFELLFGCAKLGAVLTPINWRLSDQEIASVLEDSSASLLVVREEFAARLEGHVAMLRKVVIGGSSASNYADWLTGRPDTDPRHPSSPHDVVLQLYTSGTTGVPKGVMLTEANLLALAAPGVELLSLEPASVNLVPTPLFHIGGSGYALIGLHCGCHTVLVRHPDPPEMVRVIAERRVTNVFVVPAVLSMMLAIVEGESVDLSSLQVVSYGASPISEDVLVRAMRSMDCEFVQVYGLTETTGTITLLTDADHHRALAGDHPERLRSAGRPVAGASLRIVDVASGREVPPGEVGEIWISSPQNTVGYWRKPAETAAALHPDGWLRTGDAGFMDGESYLFIHDRIKDMVISGGENVYPAEVENVIMSHPDVVEVAVIGVPDQRWGETVKAAVVARPGSGLTSGALIAFCRKRLAHYKCPTTVDFHDALPRNASGKVLKRELRARYWSDQGRAVG